MIEVVVPLYNEEENVAELPARLHAACERLDRSWRVTTVDDGSSDRTVALIEHLRGDDPRFRLRSLSRSFGHQAAIFDHPAATWDGDAPRIEGVTLMPDATFAIAAEADWTQVPGDRTEAKLAHLLDTAVRDIDYLAIPDEATSRFVAEHLPFNVINRHALTLREGLLASGAWDPVSDPIRNGEPETVVVYRNRSRQGTP